MYSYQMENIKEKLRDLEITLRNSKIFNRNLGRISNSDGNKAGFQKTMAVNGYKCKGSIKPYNQTDQKIY